jgi:hypothetical protein
MHRFSSTKEGKEARRKYLEEYNKRYNQRKMSLPDGFDMLDARTQHEVLVHVGQFNYALKRELKYEIDRELCGCPTKVLVSDKEGRLVPSHTALLLERVKFFKRKLLNLLHSLCNKA